MHKGILFDFDGVMGQTMEDNFKAWEKVFGDLGYKVKKAEFFLLEGTKLVDIALKFCQAGGIDEKLAPELVLKKDEYYKNNNSFKFYPGVEALIAELAGKQLPFGLVTSGRIERLEKTLPLGFLARFGFVVTNETSGRGKPFADPYLSGAAGINLTTSECIAIENAPLGIKSAKSAGCYCIGITSTLSKEHLAEADEIVNNFSELIELKTIKDLLK